MTNRQTVEMPIPSAVELDAAADDYIVRHQRHLDKRESLTETKPCIPAVAAWHLHLSDGEP